MSRDPNGNDKERSTMTLKNTLFVVATGRSVRFVP
ncbi:MAG: hypothetical protein QOJ58_3668 [Alphaproteobacteria bacterium]|jgi:hypothetical protein|nr:hypothetical protein [Alphaproteobacteria bacterium]